MSSFPEKKKEIVSVILSPLIKKLGELLESEGFPSKFQLNMLRSRTISYVINHLKNKKWNKGHACVLGDRILLYPFDCSPSSVGWDETNTESLDNLLGISNSLNLKFCIPSMAPDLKKCVPNQRDFLIVAEQDDTLSKIAQKLQINTAPLINLNLTDFGAPDPDFKLQRGTLVKVPSAPDNIRVFTIISASDDTLKKIAQRRQISIASLIKLNVTNFGEPNPDFELKPGTLVNVPFPPAHVGSNSGEQKVKYEKDPAPGRLNQVPAQTDKPASAKSIATCSIMTTEPSVLKQQTFAEFLSPAASSDPIPVPESKFSKEKEKAKVYIDDISLSMDSSSLPTLPVPAHGTGTLAPEVNFSCFLDNHKANNQASPNKNLRNMQSRSPSRTHLFRDNTVPPNTSFTTLTTEGGSSHAGFDSVSTKADIVRGAAEAASASSVTLPSEQQCSRQRRAGAGQSEGQRDKPANQCRPTPVLSDYSRPLAGVAGSGANTEQSADSTSRSLLRSPGRTPSIMQLLLDTPSHAQLQKNRNVMGKVATALQSLNSPKKTKSESKRKASSQQSKLNEPKKPKISPLTETSG